MLHQQAANQLEGNLLGGAEEEGLSEVLGELGSDGGGYGDRRGAIGSGAPETIWENTTKSTQNDSAKTPSHNRETYQFALRVPKPKQSRARDNNRILILMAKFKIALATILVGVAMTPSVALAQSKPSLGLSQDAATTTNSPAATVEAPAPQRYLLLATFGYLGGQAGFMLNKGSGAAASSVSIIFNSSSQCEFAENQIKERWRNDVLNTLCMPFPVGAVIAR